MTETERRYGWKPSLPDARDETADLLGMPEADSIDLRPGFTSRPFDQGQLGSCTANAVAAALQYHWGVPWVPSRLFLYYYERKIEHNLGQGDTGAFGRDGFKVARKRGVPPETLWPYDIAKFEERPSQSSIDAGWRNVLQECYKAVPQSQSDIRRVLTNKQPIAFGFTVYESFESSTVARTGQVPMPNPYTERMLGGHEMLIVGYTADHLIVRNSWGYEWGDGGYCYMPWEYILSSRFASDHRTIRRA